MIVSRPSSANATSAMHRVARGAPPRALQRRCGCGAQTHGAIECRACADKKKALQRRSAGEARDEAPPIVHQVLRSPGEPLDARTRTFMESGFGRGFAQVRTHTAGDSTRQVARAPSAHASASAPIETGRSIRPSGNGVDGAGLPVMSADGALEREAGRVADTLTTAAPSSSASPRYDFSAIRVHTDAAAVAAARSVHADAFTVGNHLVFDAGRYSPSSREGRHLLAHELTHVLQQQSAPQLQRRLSVDPNQPANAPPGDPAAGLSSTQRFATMDTLIQGLCPQFEVDALSGEVAAKGQQSLSPDALASASNAAGCCCLNILVAAPTQWTIEVSGLIGAQTDTAGHRVFLNPANSPIALGSFTPAGNLAFQGAVPAAGHELCGHAALTEASAHPSNQSRLTTDVHDPTVRIENQISREQGVPTSELRGLAASGAHRGESVDKITIGGYAVNATDVPAGEVSKLQLAAAYIQTNDEFVDVLGHSDRRGSAAAKQSVSAERANKVRTALLAQGVPPTITKHGLTNVPRFTRVAGVGDSQPPHPPLDANQDNWRRVEILMSGFPAGAQVPPAGTPTGVTPHTQNPTVPAQKSSADACVRLLVSTGYP